MITHSDCSFLKKYLSVFDNFTSNELMLWVQHIASVKYRQGAHIHSGETNDTIGMILIKSGILRIFLLSEEGREITLYRLRAGDLCLISTTNAQNLMSFNLQIEAEKNCETLIMDAASFDNFCKSSQCVEIYFTRLLTKHFSSFTEALVHALSMTLEQRLALFLYNELKNSLSNSIGLTHDQIARHIGSSREVVTRILHGFSAEGTVELSRGHLEILNKEKLKDMAH